MAPWSARRSSARCRRCWSPLKVRAQSDEAQETLDPPAGLDIRTYRSALLDRFANPALQHRTRQIAMDGSQKLPQRLVQPLIERAGAGKASPALALAIAAWMRWQAGWTDDGERFAIDDPAADRLARARGVEGYLVVLGMTPDAASCHVIADQLEILERSNARSAIMRLLREETI